MAIDRRTLIKGAVWSVPVIAVAVSAPLAAASTVEPPEEKFPISCMLINGTGNPFYEVGYQDGTYATLHRSEVVKDSWLKENCLEPNKHNVNVTVTR